MIAEAKNRANRIETTVARVCGATDVGRVREQNEDDFALSADGEVFVVADGMGGYSYGEVASALAAEAVIADLTPERRAALFELPDSIRNGLLRAVHRAHDRILRAIDEDDCRRRMGTTVVAAWVVDDTLHTCHVGDSRAYAFSGQELVQVTRDHSVVEMLVRTGQITAAQARFHPRKNQITQHLGLTTGISPTLNERPLAAGDRVLLCTDGLWGMLRHDEIGRRLAEGATVSDCAVALVEGANEMGGRDNITVVLYEHPGTEG